MHVEVDLATDRNALADAARGERRMDVATSLKVGDAVVIPWGISEVRGKIAEIYGSGRGRHVVVALQPRRAATSLTSRPSSRSRSTSFAPPESPRDRGVLVTVVSRRRQPTDAYGSGREPDDDPGKGA